MDIRGFLRILWQDFAMDFLKYHRSFFFKAELQGIYYFSDFICLNKTLNVLLI